MAEETRLLIDRLRTPIGVLLIVADTSGTLRAMDWSEFEERLMAHLRRHYRRLPEPARDPHGLTRAMAAYFAGERAAIDALPAVGSGTEFQQRVWRALRDIPCGETLSYGALARRLGQPTAMRAVGLANGANPISIVVPCHRVIGSDGSLTGYGGGLQRKRWLLAHEGARAVQLLRAAS